jgi:hypothetical protein
MTPTLKRSALTCLLATLPAVAHADVQKNVPETWPGKVMIGLRPLGLQLQFNRAWTVNTPPFYTYGVTDWALYKAAIDIEGIIASPSKVTVWLGGEINFGGRGNLAFIEPGLFVQLTLEKLLKIPLVPMIRVGFAGQAYVPYGFTGATASGAVLFKVGFGIFYFVTKNVGLGVDTDWALGAGLTKVVNGGGLNAGFTGYWDFLFGARFAF